MCARALIAVAIAALSGCSEGPPTIGPDDVKGVGVIDRISSARIDGLPHVNVWAVNGTPLARLAQLEMFSDFRAGLTFSEAEEHYGKPDSTRPLENRTELRCYRRPQATLAVALELYFSSSPPAELWTVWAFPNTDGFPLASLVQSNVLSQIRAPATPYYLVLRDATPEEQSLWLKVEAPGVTEVRWVSPHASSTRANL